MLYHYPFPSRIKWLKHAFKSGYEFVDDEGQYLGMMRFQPFSRTIESELNGSIVYFQLEGFLPQKVRITDADKETLGTISLNFFGKSTIQLTTGERYFWKRKDIFNTRWQMFHDLPDTDQDPLSIEYRYLNQFIEESGVIELEEQNDQGELLTLIGFFLGMYFTRKRRRRG